MQQATPETVLGDFNNASVQHHSVTTRFSRRDNKFVVLTDGPDGKPAEFLRELAAINSEDPALTTRKPATTR